MAIREITNNDLEAVRELLVEGFPFRRNDYWVKGLANLGSLRPVEGFPRYGYLVDADGAAQGLMLTITSDRGVHGALTNFSSWYVREGYRQFATFLFRHALKLKNTTFLNLSPSEHVVPILKAFGFEPYTTGVVMIDLRTAMRARSRQGLVQRLGIEDVSSLPAAERQLTEDHFRMGCDVLRLETGARSGLLIHRRKWIKRLLPCSQVIHADPDLIAELAGLVMRALASRGSAVALWDTDHAAEHAVGRVFERSIRYFKGAVAPLVGDLSYSELAVFGP
jgi:hypothetical protein